MRRREAATLLDAPAWISPYFIRAPRRRKAAALHNTPKLRVAVAYSSL